ncbi:MAG: TPM domain-containing protein, partial [Thermoplasmata archaeon]|nr:TPM domain-containing protein [Thermoplasmata archaeon]
MSRQERQELERQVQAIEREHPKWTAAEVEKSLRERSPIAYGNWHDETPNIRSRLRAIQRWRMGSKGRDQGQGPRHLFPY